MPVTVCRPGWAKNPATMARKVANVGAVKQGRNTMSRSASERGRLGVSIGGCSFSGGWAADARLLGCTSKPVNSAGHHHRNHETRGIDGCYGMPAHGANPGFRAPQGGAVDAPAGLASLDTLVARHAAAGLDVSVAREGEPRLLERAVDQAAYRILQEALTNAARHGTGGARVALAFGKEALELTVNNAAPGEDAPRSNGGHGLIGMRERATLLGGSLEAGRDNGWFCVRARLPYGGASA